MSEAPVVMLVEDDLAQRGIMRLVLEDAAFRVIEASSGEEAIDKLEGPGKPCCIILDLKLPKMSGQEFCKYLEQSVELEHIPVITITGFPNIAQPEHAMLQFQKPFESESVIRYIQKFCIAKEANYP